MPAKRDDAREELGVEELAHVGEACCGAHLVPLQVPALRVECRHQRLDLAHQVERRELAAVRLWVNEEERKSMHQVRCIGGRLGGDKYGQRLG